MDYDLSAKDLAVHIPNRLGTNSIFTPLKLWTSNDAATYAMGDACSDEEVGWGAISAASVQAVQTPPPKRHREPHSAATAVDSAGAVSEDDDEIGWASVGFSSRASASSKGTSGKRKPGRPPGIRGSHKFRAELKAQLKEDAAKAGSEPMTRAESLAKARAAKVRKIQDDLQAAAPVIQDSSAILPLPLPAPAPKDCWPEIGSEIEKWVHTTGMNLVHSHLEAASPQLAQEDMGSLFCRVASKMNPQTFLDTLFKPRTNDLLSSCFSKSGDDSSKENMLKAVSHLFKPYRGYCSIARDSEAFNVSGQTFARTVIRGASALKAASSKLYGNLFEHVKTMLDTSHEGMMFLANVRFDETPSKIKVSDLEAAQFPTDRDSQDRAGGKTTQASQQLAKILQTELSITMLLRSRDLNDSSSRYLLLTGFVPTALQVLDRQTGRNLKSALESSMNVPGFADLSNRFDRRCFLFTTDEFSANFSAQHGLQLSHGFWRLSLMCDVHKGSTVQGRVFDLTGPAISAIINFALSMTAAGSVGKLQAYLSDILSSRFALQIGRPALPQEVLDNNKRILDLFLAVPDRFAVETADSVSARQRLRYTQKLRQRAAIEFFCNSDFRDSSQIVHYAPPGFYQDSDQALQLFLKYCVPAFLPGPCPLFPRSRWFGADGALDFCGLLSSAYNLLVPLIESWCGREINPHVVAGNMAEVEDEDPEVNEVGWRFSALTNQSMRPVFPRSEQPDKDLQEDEGDLGELERPEQNDSKQDDEEEHAAPNNPPGTDAFDWHAYHKRLKTSVSDWLSLGVRNIGPSHVTQLALMRQYMNPILKFMTHLLYISSKRFLREQLAKEAAGETRQYRVVIAFEGLEARVLLEDALRLLNNPPVALPQGDWRRDINVLCFTMLSRLACATHQLIVWRRQKYPYALKLCMSIQFLFLRLYFQPGPFVLHAVFSFEVWPV